MAEVTEPPVDQEDKGRRATDVTTTVAAVSSQQAGQTVMANTPGHLPNAVITYVSPVIAILIRAAKAFFDTLVGVMGVQATGLMPASQDFYHSLYLAAGIAGTAAVVSIIRNMAQLFSSLEQKFPVIQA